MLFGKNKELRNEVDNWIYDKNFYHKMLTIKDEKRQLIIDKILNKKEKKDFENFFFIYKQLPGKYDFDTKEEVINKIKKVFFENKDNPDITSNIKRAILWELVHDSLIDILEYEFLKKYANDPAANNFTIKELHEYVKQSKKDFKAKELQKEKEEKEADKRRREEEKKQAERIKQEEEKRKTSKKDEDYDDSEDEQHNEDDEDLEDEEADEDEEFYEDEDVEEADEDNEDEELDEDNEDEDNEDEEFDEDEENFDNDDDSDNEKSIDDVEDIYDVLEYEKYTTEFDYHSSRIEDKLKDFLEDKDFDSIDGFTKGFLMFPFAFFESVFVCVQYYAAKTFIDRVDFLKEFLEDSLNDYDDKEIKKYIKKSLEELNGSQEELDGCRQLCDSIEEKALEEEKLLKKLTKKIYDNWTEKNPFDDENDIKNILVIYKNYCLHYQSFDIKKLLLELLAKYYPLNNDSSLEDSMNILYHQSIACVYSMTLLDALFSNRKLTAELKSKIVDTKDTLQDFIDKFIELQNKYNEKMKLIKQKQEENAAKIAAYRKKQQEMYEARQNRVLDRQEMQEHVAKEQRKNKKSKLKSFIGFINKLNNIGSSSNTIDLNRSINNISQYILRRNQYPIGHEGRRDPTERINNEKLKIRKTLNLLTEDDLKKLHFSWDNILEKETGIRTHEANLNKLTALEAILNI